MSFESIRIFFHKKSHARYVVFFSLFFLGVIFAWGSVAYALTHHPLLSKVFQDSRLPENTKISAKKTQQKKLVALPETLSRKLDGRSVAAKDANNYPVAVMIENLVTVRPQAGLGQAQVVYESLVEGGITRFMALYDVLTEPVGQIGPVRSARPYYLEWVSEYDALYAHAGGSPEALQSISGFEIQDLNQIGGSAQYFWRDQGDAAPHNLYSSSELLQLALRDRTLDTQEPTFTTWNFSTDSQSASQKTPPSKNTTYTGTDMGKPNTNVVIDYSSPAYQVRWEHESETKEYLRFNGGEEHKDRGNDRQIRAKNVIVIIIPEVSGVGEKGRLTLDIHGEGRAYVAREGEIVEGKWVKRERTDRTKFFDAQEKEITLRPGSTWVQIVPADRGVSFE